MDALAQALRLDRKATEYLHRVADPTGSRPPQSTVQTVTQRLRQLIDQMSFRPICPTDTWMCSPPIQYARALTRARRPQPHVLGLPDRRARELYVNWDELTDIAVCEFAKPPPIWTILGGVP